MTLEFPLRVTADTGSPTVRGFCIPTSSIGVARCPSNCDPDVCQTQAQGTAGASCCCLQVLFGRACRNRGTTGPNRARNMSTYYYPLWSLLTQRVRALASYVLGHSDSRLRFVSDFQLQKANCDWGASQIRRSAY